MLKKTLGAVATALLGVTMLATGAVAQEATPAATGDCATTSADENIQIVQDYFDAVLSGDAVTADALLHDDYQHNLSVPGAEVPNEPGNADELENIDSAGSANVEIKQTVAQDDWVAVYFNFDVPAENIQGATEGGTATIGAMAMVRIECGMIAEGLFEFDALDLLQQHGFEIVPPGEAG